jgi:hypothetical protein
MRDALLAATLMLGALAGSARAEGVPQIIGGDPLSNQILAKTSLPNGGVTAAVRAGSGEVVVLHLGDVSAPFGASLAPAAASPGAPLKTAPELKPKRAKRAKAERMPRRAVDQLKRVRRAHLKSWQ